MASMRLPPLPTVRDLVKLYRLRAVKQLSQNFIMSDELCSKIVKQAGKITDHQVIEVGPGPGGLTRAIIHNSPKILTVIEKDKRFQPTLEMLGETFSKAGGNMKVVFDDIMRTPLESFIDQEAKVDWNDDRCPQVTIIGNLPFNVSTHLIIRWLEKISRREGAWSVGRARMLLTFQKEVCERLVAPPSHPQRCRMSVMAQAWTKPQLRFLIPGKAFVPKPKVDVGVVGFEPLKKPVTDHEFKFFEKVVRHIFNTRRKYSSKSFGTLFPPDVRKEMTLTAYKLADVDPTMRCVQLGVADIHRLCSAYKYLLEKHPEIRNYDFRASKKILSSDCLRHLSVTEIDDYDEKLDEESEDEFEEGKSKIEGGTC